jgi:tetratricopeptide (TPR) repeat protein
MGTPLLVEFFHTLPEDALFGGLDWPVVPTLGANNSRATQAKVGGKARRRAAVHVFCKEVQGKYTEGTLLRLLNADEIASRRAAAFALGLLGSFQANEPLASRLHDEDDEVARLASEALWTLWFRGDNAAHNDELYRVLRMRDGDKASACLDDLIRRAPKFAEARHQRAIQLFHAEQFERAAEECRAVLRINPHHFAAQAKLGECYMRLGKNRLALKTLRVALRINPRLSSVAEMVKTLEEMLGEDTQAE